MSFATIFDTLRSRRGIVLIAPALLLGGLAVWQSNAATWAPITPAGSEATDRAFSAAQRKDIEAVVKNFLLNNPEFMLEVQAALEEKVEKETARKTAAALKTLSTEIFRPKFSPVVGNPQGDVTIVEFFDYNCGYCKKALTDVAKLIEQEKGVKVIMKELPILAKGSEESAKVALAAKMQGKYWEFHRAMLSASGTANEASALRIAEKVGLNMDQIKKDMASPEVAKEIEDTRALAEKLQVRGTPFFMVADRIIPGAPGNLLEQMAKHVADVRQEGGCKVC
jgi:protein-disulfide isomerase